MTTVQLRDVHSQNLETGGVDGRPVVILLHGYGSNESDLTGLVPPLEIEGPWASLRAPIELGNGGAAWFTIVTPGDPDAEPVVAATDAIWSWIDSDVSPTATVIPIGFSQGGLMASQLLRSRPERVRATVILGGFVLGAPQPADDALATSQPPVFWGRGEQDRVITAAAVERTGEYLPKHSALVERIYPGLAHGISAEELADVRAFLTANGL
jgi:phospholipase/carboxylesterase